jgi:hypothetical protein
MNIERVRPQLKLIEGAKGKAAVGYIPILCTAPI